MFDQGKRLHSTATDKMYSNNFWKKTTAHELHERIQDFSQKKEPALRY